MSKYNPEHYRQGNIEPWDFISSQGLGFLEGNVVKYITRAGKKQYETRLDDLLKAKTYLNKLISLEVDAPRPAISSDSLPSIDGPADRSVLSEYLRDPESFNY